MRIGGMSSVLVLGVAGYAFALNLWAANGFPSLWVMTPDRAVYIQAFGSVGAILAAVGVAWHQGRVSRRIAEDAQSMTRRVALDAQHLSERIAAEEARRLDEAVRNSQRTSAMWICMVIGDLIEEADRIHTVLAGITVVDEQRLLSDEHRDHFARALSHSRFGLADAADHLLDHCERLPAAPAFEVMRVLRTLSQYRVFLARVEESVARPTIWYATIRTGVQNRVEEAEKIREGAKRAYDAVQAIVPAIYTRAQRFSAASVAHLGAPLEDES